MISLRANQNKIRTTETKKKADRLFETVLIAMAIVLGLNSVDVFADTAANAAADLEVRRHAMLQAWLYEDHTLITNEEDRKKYRMPLPGTPEYDAYTPGRALMSGPPMTIAGDEPDLLKYILKKENPD